MSFARILISVDGEPVAAHAADVGIELATLLSAEIAIIHIVDPSLYRASESGVPADEIISLAEQDGRRLLAGFRQRMAQQSISLEFIRVGKPATEILKAAKEWPADLIVIGSHGRR